MNPRRVTRSALLLGAALTVFCLATPATAGVGPRQFIRGDFDADGDNDLADGIGLLNYLFVAGSPPPVCEDAADVNDDGALSLVDAVYQLTHALAGGTPPPAPYPDCGVDLTFDALGCDDGTFCPAATLPPNLNVAFCDELLEQTPGAKMWPNSAPITPGNFDELRFRMRPMTISIGASIGTVDVTQSGPIELYDLSGNLLGNPASFPVASLPTQVLINATAVGTGTLTAIQIGGGGSVPDIVTIRSCQDTGLVGREITDFPGFEFTRTINSNAAPVQTALEPNRNAERAGLAYRIYVVESKTPAEWAADNSLVDITGGFEIGTVNGSSIQTNIEDVWTSGLDGGTGVVGKGYDVVFDFGLDATLDPGDMIDGLKYGEAGFYIVGSMTGLGPHSVTETIYSGGTWLGQDLYYPTDIATLDNVPIVVISHGNGHNYQWYDYLGNHLASWGYVVMSHENQTGPGIETASTTTLTNTDYLLDNLATIAGGALNGRVDTNWIAWIGHSRGGEGVPRAYDRLIDGPLPAGIGFDETQVKFVSSIAPTVFLSTSQCDPHDVNYHLIAGAADGDVNGCANCSVCQYFRIHQRGTGTTSATYVQGASHNDFNCCGFADGTGPSLIGRPAAQAVAKAYYLAHMEYYARGNMATKDFLIRNFESFHPIGIGGNVRVANQWLDPGDLNTEIDNYQTSSGTGTSSSGQPVTFDVSNVTEGIMDDNNTSFTWTVADAMNGMTQAEFTPDNSRGVVFDWPNGSTRFYQYDVAPGETDFSDDAFLTFRACQGTRHPNTVSLAGTLDFTVTLIDGSGTSASINFGEFGTLTRPYLRSGCGTGSGWANEFNIVRLRLADFENDNTGIDLTDVTNVRFDFGSTFGSNLGRIGVDDLRLTKD